MKFTLQLDPVKDVEGGNEKGVSIAEFQALVANGRNGALLFDIETGPAEESVLEELFKDVEVKLPENPGRFDPSKVKYGNTKDPAKKQEKLSSEMAKHQSACESWADDCRKAKDDAWKEFVDKAPLSPLTGRVMAIGYGLTNGKDAPVLCIDATPDNEHLMLIRLWNLVSVARKRSTKIASFNGHRFDFPFCRRRSWAYTDINPPDLVTKYGKYEDGFYDVLEIYQRGGAYKDSIKLDRLAQMMSVQRKMEGVTGEMFHQLIQTDRQKALDYLTGDILCLEAVAERMRIL